MLRWIQNCTILCYLMALVEEEEHRYVCTQALHSFVLGTLLTLSYMDIKGITALYTYLLNTHSIVCYESYVCLGILLQYYDYKINRWRILLLHATYYYPYMWPQWSPQSLSGAINRSPLHFEDDKGPQPRHWNILLTEKLQPITLKPSFGLSFCPSFN